MYVRLYRAIQFLRKYPEQVHQKFLCSVESDIVGSIIKQPYPRDTGNAHPKLVELLFYIYIYIYFLYYVQIFDERVKIHPNPS